MALGTLTIDIAANVARLSSDLGRAARISEQQAEDMRRRWEKASQLLGTAVSAIGAGAFAAWIKSSAEAIGQLEQFAQLSNTTTTEFQRFAAGARTVGIEHEQLASILKDVNDKVGDFLVTGGGEMADFFEKVAPKVGVTAEQFKNLSGPQALQLYVDTLEKAGANQQELTFFMESLADDATVLLPLLREGGKGLKGFADEASNLGLVLSEDQIKNAGQFTQDLDLLGRVASSVGQQVVGELLPELSALTQELRDPETAKAAASMAKAVVSSFTAITEGARETVRFIQWAAESAAAFMNGAAADDIVRLEDQLERQKQALADYQQMLESPLAREGMQAELLSSESEAQLKADIAATEAQIEAFYKSQREKPAVVIPVEPAVEGGKSAGSKGLGLQSKEAEEAAKKAETAAKRTAEAIRSQIATLQQQAATVGKTTAEVTLYKLAQDGATASQLAQAQAALDTVAAYEKHQQALEKRAELARQVAQVEEVGWSDTSRALLAYQQQVEILQAGVLAGVISEAQRDRVIAGLEEQAAAAEQSADQMTVFMDEAARNIQDAFADFLFDPFAEGLDGMAVGFLRVVQRMAAEAAAAQLANQLFGAANASGQRGGGLVQAGVSWLGDLFANAKGNAFAGGEVIPFAKGGAFTNSIVDTPTLFPFAKGTGLMGEAGPEAIMPLGRSSDGSLGVRMIGGGSGGGQAVVISVEVNIQSDGSVTAQANSQAGQQFGADVGRYIEQRYKQLIAKDLAPGGQIWRSVNGR
ncbi:phage tail tape measure protein [Azotobacter chroococcum]|uniref:phage tail tape measure protein n=1 Tax=Azotobacter chroococcum TaxID=353 RepID=UPI000B78EFD6|nr:phage tail tape measure protein [Azotobacter chroococcum]